MLLEASPIKVLTQLLLIILDRPMDRERQRERYRERQRQTDRQTDRQAGRQAGQKMSQKKHIVWTDGQNHLNGLNNFVEEGKQKGESVNEDDR